MKKYVLPVLISLMALGVAASRAATDSPSKESPLAGKFVLVSIRSQVFNNVYENVRFESVGETDFIVLPMRHGGTTVTNDYWLPLKDVTSLRVYHTKSDVDEYVEKRDAQRNVQADQPNSQGGPNAD